jgi:hypothetical protein
MKFLLLIGLFLLTFRVSAQITGFETGRLTIIQDDKIDSLIQIRKEVNKVYSNIYGFRIQIFMESGNEAVQKAEAVIRMFKEQFPEIPAYLTFGQPYYRIRVGDFRNRIEAEGFLHQAMTSYNQAFVVKEKIYYPQLKSSSNQNHDI